MTDHLLAFAPLRGRLTVVGIANLGESRDELLAGARAAFEERGLPVPSGLDAAPADDDLWTLVRGRIDDPKALAQVVLEIGADGVARQPRRVPGGPVRLIERPGRMVYGRRFQGGAPVAPEERS